jgi:hypothetical protein
MKRRPDHAKDQPNIVCKQARDQSNPSNRNWLFIDATDEPQIARVLQKLLELPDNAIRKSPWLVLFVDFDAGSRLGF